MITVVYFFSRVSEIKTVVYHSLNADKNFSYTYLTDTEINILYYEVNIIL